jgi:hypothetical protein
MFMERNLKLTNESGHLGFMTPFTWMFLSSYEKLRKLLLEKHTLNSLVKPSYTAFFDSAIVAICAFVVSKTHLGDWKGSFFDLEYLGNADEQSPRFLKQLKDKSYFSCKNNDFKKIPGSPIAYWASQQTLKSFSEFQLLENVGLARQGASTSDNDRFLRRWYEVSKSKLGLNINSLNESIESKKKWFPYNKGGDYRKWYGNCEYIINYENDGYDLKEFQSTLNQGWTARLKSREYYFKNTVSWSKITSSLFSTRYYPDGFIFDV